MTAVRTVALIAGREVRQRLRSKLFVWTTAVISLLLTVGALVPWLIGSFGADLMSDPTDAVVTIAVVGELDEARVSALESQFGAIELEPVADDAAARAKLDEQDGVDLAIIDGARVLVAPTTGAFPGVGSGRANAAAEALALVDLLEDNGAADIAPGILGITPLPVETVGERDPTERVAGLVVANVGVVFLFGLLMFYASMIVNGIIEEKGSRVVELLVEAVPVRQLMTGKVLGMGIIAIGQATALFAPALLVLLLTYRDLLPPGSGVLVAAAALWFVLGYAFYALLCAGLGALVSRPEEAQAVLTPATMLALVGYFLGFIAIQQPDALWSVIAGWLPPTAPFVMLVRQAVGEPTAVELVGSVVLLLVGIVGAALLTARIYEGGILRVGARVRFGEAWRGSRL